MEEVKEMLRDLVLEKGVVDIIMNYKKEMETLELENREFFKNIIDNIVTDYYYGTIHPVVVRSWDNDRLTFKFKQDYQYLYNYDIGQRTTNVFVSYTKYMHKEEEIILNELIFPHTIQLENVRKSIKELFNIYPIMQKFI